MAVKLSSYYWFRNNCLVQSLENRHTAYHYFRRELAPEDRKTLQHIVEELDKLKEGSYFQQREPVLTERVAIANVAELKDVTRDSQLAATYLEGIHAIMEKYAVEVDMYRQLGQCFEEIGIEPNPDIAEAVKYANNIISHPPPHCTGSLEHMWWQFTKKQREREAKNKGFIPIR